VGGTVEFGNSIGGRIVTYNTRIGIRYGIDSINLFSVIGLVDLSNVV